MVNLRVKMFGGLILLVVLCVLFYLIQFSGSSAVALEESLAQHRMDIYNAAQMLEKQAAQQAIVEKSIIDNQVNTVELYGNAMRTLEGKTDIDGLARHIVGQNMAVIQITDGAVQLPETVPSGLLIDPEEIREEKGAFTATADDGKTYVNYYCKLSENAYLLEWEDSEESLIVNYIRNKRADTIRTIEDAMEMYILEFALADGTDMTLAEPIYASEAFSGYLTAKDYGITPEMFDSATEIAQDGFPDSDPAASEPPVGRQSLTVGDVQYDCYFRKTGNGTSVTVFMIPSDRPVARASEQTALLLTAFAIVGFTFLVWALSVFHLVIRHNLDEKQKKAYQPRTVYRRAAVLLLSELLAFAGVSVFLQCLFASFNVSAGAEATLRALDTRLASDIATAEVFQSVQMKNYEASAEAIGVLVSSEGDRADQAFLDSACAAIGADYIIIYNEKGTEVLSNTTYSGLTLSAGGEDMQDFRRLLKGVSPISKAQATDAQTALTHSVFGVSLARTGDDNRDTSYWAMLLFVDPDRISDESVLSMNEIMQSVDALNTIYFSVDPESGRILSSSEPMYLGKDAVSLGLPQDALTDQYHGFFWIDDVRVYGISAEKDGILYYSIVSQQQLYRHVPQNTLRAVLAYLVLMAVLAVFLLYGYQKTFDQYAERGNLLDDSENLVMTPTGRLKTSIDPSLRWKLTEYAFGSRTPSYNAMYAGQALYMIAAFVIAVFAQIGIFGTENSAIAYILSGRWSRGFNLFALTAIVFLFVTVSALTIFCKFMITTVTRSAGTKGETIGRLLLDFIRYLSLMVFAYHALSFLGVNTAALVASLGIISFALSFGSQELIQDIIAGLSIVMEGEFQVGDIIEVDGFRGKVLAVGVRTTKIEGRGGNILIMSNQDMKNVINKTRKNSWYAMEINISEDEDLAKVESLLKEHLPAIASKIPEIVSGPYYKGIVEIAPGAFSLSIIAECIEEDYHKVQRKLNGEIAAFLEENGISTK